MKEEQLSCTYIEGQGLFRTIAIYNDYDQLTETKVVSDTENDGVK